MKILDCEDNPDLVSFIVSLIVSIWRKIYIFYELNDFKLLVQFENLNVVKVIKI